MPVKNSRSDDGQPFSRIDFFTEMGKCRLFPTMRPSFIVSM